MTLKTVLALFGTVAGLLCAATGALPTDAWLVLVTAWPGAVIAEHAAEGLSNVKSPNIVRVGQARPVTVAEAPRAQTGP